VFDNSILQQITTDPVIAVIDDDESVAISLARFLRASGFQSSVYRSATAFLDDPEHHRFDCLIVDLQLEGMSGVELSRHLALVGDRAPMILMTALDERELDRTVLQKEDVVFMRKSEPGEALLATLNLLLHQSRDRVNGARNGCNA